MFMAYKDIERGRAAIRRHYYSNRQYYIDKAKRRKRDIRELVMLIKQVVPCRDCDKHYPYYVMDFDHVNKKAATINVLIEKCNIGRLEEEMANCELVCSNCHRIRTYERITQSSSIL
jgi:5-methylcytosine-specific restriction endonuclease McrA